MPGPLDVSGFEVVLGVGILLSLAALLTIVYARARGRIKGRDAIVAALIALLIPVLGPALVLASAIVCRTTSRERIPD